jgi:putative transposase
MKMDPLHNRHSIRLRDYDYTQPGAYFITVCAHERACLFGDIADGEMRLNEYGRVATECWNDLPKHYSHIELDAFVVMPNHVHGIIVLTDVVVGAGLRPAPTTPKHHGLPEIVRAFKSFSARRINEGRNTSGIPVWQRNYYEHVVRGESELNTIRHYIVNNSLRWADDEDNPARLK